VLLRLAFLRIWGFQHSLTNLLTTTTKYNTTQDGQFLYPGVDGPIPTTRLFQLREGLQDAEMFRMLPENDAKALIETVLRGSNDFDNDVEKIEAVRVQAGDKVELALKQKQ